jgi:conserved hypothetical protein TIGR00266
MKYEIFGDNLQMVNVEMDGNEKLFGEAGVMVYMSNDIKMEPVARGGFLKGLGRKMFMGESFFLTEFTGRGNVAFAGNVPGKIIVIKLGGGKNILAQRDAFLCASDKIELSMEFQKRLSSTFFGGEGWIIEKISGEGTCFLHACGDIKEIELKSGETIKVDTGSVVAWEDSVNYSVNRVKGVKTVLFAGEGLFLTTLTGAGKVWIQSMTLHNLASALSPFISGKSSGSGGVLSTLTRESFGRR